MAVAAAPQKKGWINYIQALRPDRLEPFQTMPCDPEVFVLTDGRCRR